MRLIKPITILIFLVISLDAFSAGDGEGHKTITSLLWPFLNFVLLVSFIIFKMKKPLSVSFDENSKKVKDLFNIAEEKNKEAEIKLSMYKEKMNNFENHADKVKAEAITELNLNQEKLKNESDKIKIQIEKETKEKIKNEESSLVRKLREELIGKVLTDTKNKIKSDEKLSQKAAENLLARV